IQLPPRLGLIDDSNNRWSNFSAQIAHLNTTASEGICYKVIFIGRHGQGFHNVGEAKYGTKAWDEYWAKMNGDGEIIWGPDPELTELGKEQARAAHAAWAAELPFKIPLPEALYCSPLTRAIRTNVLTFEGIFADEGPKTTIVENCREANGVHTCDKRRTLSYIKAEFPNLAIEPGFTEKDELWNPDTRETEAELEVRAKAVLDMIFDTNDGQYISITAHGGIARAFMRIVGHVDYGLPVGGQYY
ncbi:histidine phosphatase superfamily, partial [Hygrophoropsis aurantiaca]